MTRTVTDAVFGAVIDHAQPLLTYYNEATGERTELSAATLGNWAAKIGNYLRDEVGVFPGDVVTVDLPEHWQSAAIYLGAWWAGAHVDTRGDADAVVTFAARSGIDEHPDAAELVAVPLDAFAMGRGELPIGVADFGTAVRVHGDRFASADAGPEALDDLSPDAVITAAQSAAAAAEIASGDRVASTHPWRTGADLTANLLAPLITGASLVWVGGADADRLAHIAGNERARLLP